MKILECMGTLVIEVGVDGGIPDGGLRFPVWVVLSYKVRLGTTQALKVDVYGRQLPGFGTLQNRIDLDNGIVMHGRLIGARWDLSDHDAITRCDLVDVDIEGGRLVTQGAESGVECDEIIAPLPSSWPLATGGCRSRAT